jgi:hypothetical protein
MKRIILEKHVEEPVSEKQLRYIQDLMTQKRLYNTVYLDNLAFDTRNRLSKHSASRLIDCLIRGQEFEFQER